MCAKRKRNVCAKHRPRRRNLRPHTAPSALWAAYSILAGAACGRDPVSAPPQHPAVESYPLSCTLAPDDDEHVDCLRPDGDAFRMNPTLLRSLAPAGKALFALRSEVGFFWVRADGLARATPTFDNWADYYCHGLTRTLQGQKVGFMNRQLEIVVPPTYSFASPFQGGQAAVCNECREQRTGEHTAISCAKCRIVDTQGHMLNALEQDTETIWSQLPEAQDDACGEP